MKAESDLERHPLDKPAGQRGYLEPRSKAGPWLGPLRGCQAPSSHGPGGISPWDPALH